jgi:hypothetical protein
MGRARRSNFTAPVSTEPSAPKSSRQRKRPAYWQSGAGVHWPKSGLPVPNSDNEPILREHSNEGFEFCTSGFFAVTIEIGAPAVAAPVSAPPTHDNGQRAAHAAGGWLRLCRTGVFRSRFHQCARRSLSMSSTALVRHPGYPSRRRYVAPGLRERSRPDGNRRGWVYICRPRFLRWRCNKDGSR